MHSLFMSAPPGTYDVIVVDAEYGEQLYREHHLASLPRALWHSDDLLGPFRDGEPTRVDGAVYGAVVRWGALGLVFDVGHITRDAARSYAILFEPAVERHVGIFDWYLPTMGVLSRYLGNGRPYDIDRAQLDRIAETLTRLRRQARSIQPSTSEVINDLRIGESWVVPGIGEWAAAVLAEEGRQIDWVVPDEGGIMWVEAFAIAATSRQRSLAEAFISAARTPESLARLAWRKAYHSQVTRTEAYHHLSQEQRNLLKANDLNGLQQLAERLAVRKLPGPRTTERDWLEVWTHFKSAS
jgi:spermidine/putrescine transport system substrate-binding protein